MEILLCLLCSKPSFVFGFLLDSAFHCAYNRHMDFVRVSIEQLAKWHCQCAKQQYVMRTTLTFENSFGMISYTNHTEGGKADESTEG